MASDDNELPRHETGREVMDCQEAIHTLYHFLDGELTDYRRVEIKAHLEGCMPCLEAFDFEAELRVVIARKCRDDVPDSLRERIAKAIMHEGGSELGISGL